MISTNRESIESQTTPEIFEQIVGYEHEQVVFCYDKSTGLQSIIAIHNTTLGPALGGTRMWQYENGQAALHDVLRLSRGMTYKSAISGINLGGGKAVIIGNPYKDKTEALLRRYGRFVDSLNGKYITAEDVGTSPKDIEYIRMETDFCAGFSENHGGSGDPSPVTAYGTYLGIKAASKKAYGSDSLEGKTVMVQGVGHVGQHLIKHLSEENARILISDINEKHLKQVTDAYKVTVIPVEEVYDVHSDIYAPCALGATLNDDTIPGLHCKVIAGAANNQLKDEKKHGRMLMEKGIYYAPDFVINAGGVINCYAELEGYNRKRALKYTDNIYSKTLDLFTVAEEADITTHEAAIKEAQKRIDAMAMVHTRM